MKFIAKGFGNEILSWGDEKQLSLCNGKAVYYFCYNIAGYHCL